jgi:hypothetical protein
MNVRLEKAMLIFVLEKERDLNGVGKLRETEKTVQQRRPIQ